MAFQWPSIPYPPSQEGFWAPVTSTINWCEEDYYATIYSAEIVNTLTNILFIALGVKGIRNCLRYGHDTIFLVAFIGYVMVGSGSFAFHSTLKYPMQLVDELSMIYSSLIMLYASFSLQRSARFLQVLGVSLVSLGLFITLYYHYLQDPVFHQNAFALITIIVVVRSMYMMEVNLRPSLRKKATNGSGSSSKALQLVNEQRDKIILKEMWWMVAIGLSIFLGGFAIWGLDRIYCSNIRRWRRQIGLPWGILLEGHGWWHIMTGVGSYFYIVWAIWLRYCMTQSQDKYALNWPGVVSSLPEVVLRKELKPAAGSNGHLKGE